MGSDVLCSFKSLCESSRATIRIIPAWDLRFAVWWLSKYNDAIMTTICVNIIILLSLGMSSVVHSSVTVETFLILANIGWLLSTCFNVTV